MKRLLLIVLGAILVTFTSFGERVTDRIDYSNVTTTESGDLNTLLNYTSKGVSGTDYAVFAFLETLKDDSYPSFGFNSKNKAGLINSKSCGTVKQVKISVAPTYDSENDKEIYVFVSNKQFNGVQGLYSEGLTPNYTVKYNTKNSKGPFVIDIEGNYPYVGIRSGANMYFDSFEIEWETEGTVTPPAVEVKAPIITCEDNIVSMSSEEGTDIYYTIDGTKASLMSKHYKESFEITETTTIRAIAVKNSFESEETVYTAEYKAPVVEKPVITCTNNTVSITAAQGALVYYTLDGSEPSESSTKYSSPFLITVSCTVNAIAFVNGVKSEVASIYVEYEAPKPVVAAPKIECANNKVTIAAEAGAKIYYTLDGSVPTTASAVYKEPIEITKDTTVKAIAVIDGTASDVAQLVVQYEAPKPVVAAPKIECVNNKVTITAEAGAKIYYTLDGSNPTTASYVYEKPIEITKTTTVKAIAVVDGTASDVAQLVSEYVAPKPVVAAPKIECVNNLITITAEAKAKIYFTIDGTDPVVAEKDLYKEPFFITQKRVIKAIAAIGEDVSAVTTLEAEYVAPKPAVSAPKIECVDNMVTITAQQGAKIYYTIDGTEPNKATSYVYTRPIEITKNTTVKAMAVVDGNESAVTTFEAKYVSANPTEYDSFGELTDADSGKRVIINGPLTVLYQDGNDLYVKDSEGTCMLVRDTAGFGGMKAINGDRLASVEGTFRIVGGIPQITSPVRLGDRTQGNPVKPEETTVEDLSLDMVNEFVKLTDVRIEEQGGKYYAVDKTGNRVEVKAGKDGLKTGDGFTVTGIVSREGNTVVIIPSSVEARPEPAECKTPVFSVDAGYVNSGTAVTIKCDTKGAAIHYTTDGSEPDGDSAEYNGESIIIENTMTVKAVAILKGYRNSAVAVAEYTVLSAGTEMASFSFVGDDSNITDLEGGEDLKTGEDGTADTHNKLADVKLTNGEATMWFSQGSGTMPRWWKDSTVRAYGKNAINVTVPEGYTIDQVTIVTGETNFVNSIIPGGTWSVNTWTSLRGVPGTSDSNPDARFDPVNLVRIEFRTMLSIYSIKVIYSDIKASGIDDITMGGDDYDNAEPEYYNMNGIKVENPAPGLYIMKKGGKTGKVIIR